MTVTPRRTGIESTILLSANLQSMSARSPALLAVRHEDVLREEAGGHERAEDVVLDALVDGAGAGAEEQRRLRGLLVEDALELEVERLPLRPVVRRHRLVDQLVGLR